MTFGELQQTYANLYGEMLLIDPIWFLHKLHWKMFINADIDSDISHQIIDNDTMFSFFFDAKMRTFSFRIF